MQPRCLLAQNQTQCTAGARSAGGGRPRPPTHWAGSAAVTGHAPQSHSCPLLEGGQQDCPWGGKGRYLDSRF